MRTMLQLLLGAMLTIGVSASAHAAAFDLTFANPGADCALQANLPSDCANSIDVINPGFLSFDVGGGVRLFVNAIATINSSTTPSDWERGIAIQDFPDLGGLAVLSDTDQVEFDQGLYFALEDRSAFLPSVSFTDDHAPIDPDTVITVLGYIDGVLETILGETAGDLAAGALLGENPAINSWLFYNRDPNGPTWYISSMSVVPEPGTAALLGLGVIALGTRRRKALA